MKKSTGYRSSGGGQGIGGLCGVWAFILALNLILGGWATQYVVQFWGGYFTHHVVVIPFLVCALAGLVLGQFTIPLAVITFLCSFFLNAPGY